MPRDKDSSGPVQSGAYADRAIDRRVAPTSGGEKVTPKEAVALGFTKADANKITKVSGQYVFDPSLDAKPIGVSTSGFQATPYKASFGYGGTPDQIAASTAYQLSQEQYQAAYDAARAQGLQADVDTRTILKFQEQNVNAFIEKKTSEYYQQLKAENPGWTEENLQRAASDQAKGLFGRGDSGLGMGGGDGIASAGGEGTASLTAGTSTGDGEVAVVDAETMAKRISAWTTLRDELGKYGLEGLADAVKQLILDGANAAEITMKLRQTPEYMKRFSGNEQRRKQGFNVYDEATYLDLENAFDQAFAAYNQLDLLGTNKDQRRAKYADFIAGNKSAVEIKQRLQLAADVAQEDVNTKAALKKLYPMISDIDIAAYFLDPDATFTKLQAKVQAAQIGGAALKQGLVADTLLSEELAAMGISKEMAAQGYQNVAAVLPKATFLSEISGTDKFTQQTAEDIYLKGLASEQRKLEKLSAQEANRFRGGAGTTRTSLTSKGTAGQV